MPRLRKENIILYPTRIKYKRYETKPKKRSNQLQVIEEEDSEVVVVDSAAEKVKKA